MGEACAFASEAVEVGGFVEGAAVAGEVALAEVVGEEEDDVGWAVRGGGLGDECCEDEGEKAFHGDWVWLMPRRLRRRSHDSSVMLDRVMSAKEFCRF